MILTLSLIVKDRIVPVTLSFCAGKVPMFATTNLLLVVQGRAHRGLVGDPKGEVRAGCIAWRPQRSGGPGGTRNLFREEGTQCWGNLLGRTVAAMKPEAQPVPRQDSRQAKAAVGCDPHRKAAWPRHPRAEALPARTPSRARSVPNHQG